MRAWWGIFRIEVRRLSRQFVVLVALGFWLVLGGSWLAGWIGRLPVVIAELLVPLLSYLGSVNGDVQRRQERWLSGTAILPAGYWVSVWAARLMPFAVCVVIRAMALGATSAVAVRPAALIRLDLVALALVGIMLCVGFFVRPGVDVIFVVASQVLLLFLLSRAEWPTGDGLSGIVWAAVGPAWFAQFDRGSTAFLAAAVAGWWALATLLGGLSSRRWVRWLRGSDA